MMAYYNHDYADKSSDWGIPQMGEKKLAKLPIFKVKLKYNFSAKSKSNNNQWKEGGEDNAMYSHNLDKNIV